MTIVLSAPTKKTAYGPYEKSFVNDTAPSVKSRTLSQNYENIFRFQAFLLQSYVL